MTIPKHGYTLQMYNVYRFNIRIDDNRLNLTINLKNVVLQML